MAGTITWGRNGLPVRSGLIRMASMDNRMLWVQAATDASGGFRADLPTGTYRLSPQGLGRGEQPEWKKSVVGGATSKCKIVVTQTQVGLETVAGPGRRQTAGEGYRQGLWTTLTLADGLPDPFVFAVHDAGDGVLWLGTDGGAVKYDGESFSLYDSTQGFPLRAPESVVQDREGRLWFGGWGGAVRFDGHRFEHFSSADGLPGDHVQCILPRPDGEVWFGTELGLATFDGQSFGAIGMEDGMAGGEVRSLVPAPGDVVWAVGRGITRLQGGTPQAAITPPPDWQGGMGAALGDEGALWISTDGQGLFRYDGQAFEQWTSKDGLAHNVMSRIALDPDGVLWCGTFEGLSLFDGEHFVNYGTREGLPGSWVTGSLIDADDNVWVTTLGGGIARWDGRRIRSFTAEDGIPGGMQLALFEDRAGRIWTGSYFEGGAASIEGNAVRAYLPGSGLPGEEAKGISQTRDGTLWFATEKGASRFDGDDFETITAADGLASSEVLCVFEDRSGALWFGTVSGLTRYELGVYKTFTDRHGLPSSWVRSVLEDPSGRLLVGTTAGVASFDGNSFTPLPGLAALPPVDVWRLLVGRDGRLWVASQGQGLLWLEDGNLGRLGVADGLASDEVTGIAEDTRGRMWITTAGGGLGVNDGTVFQTIRSRDGLLSDFLLNAMVDSRGAVWTAGDGGVTRYQAATVPPGVSVRVTADSTYGEVEAVSIPSYQQFVRFEVQGRSFTTPPDQMVYLYRLRGWEDDWQQTRQNEIVYTSLPVGEYLFEVKAVDRDLNYTVQPAKVALAVVHRLISSSVLLSELQVSDLFASFYRSYGTQPFGSVRVTNHGGEAASATLRFFIPGRMMRHSKQALTLAPNSSQVVPLTAQLDRTILEVVETETVEAEVSLAFSSGDQEVSIQETRETKLYARGAMRWESEVGRAAAFVTPTASAVEGFARPLLASLDAGVRSLGGPGRNVLTAMLLFEGLRQHGLVYIRDANRPETQASSRLTALDHIQYPGDVLHKKGGDCDDLTVLFCSLLENVEVPTALVDIPGHILMMFDTGVSRRDAYKLPVDDDLLFPRGDRMWIPVEITRLNGSFLEAWRAGAAELGGLSRRERLKRVVDTKEAWVRYPSSDPARAGVVEPPFGDALEERFRAQRAAVEEMIDGYLEENYLDPLEADPSDEALRSRLLMILVALRQFDKAIDTGLDHLMTADGPQAATCNHLGVAYLLKGEARPAAYYFQLASRLRPEDRGIRSNLARAMAELGVGSAEVGAVADVAEAADGQKAAAPEGDEDSFYWVE